MSRRGNPACPAHRNRYHEEGKEDRRHQAKYAEPGLRDEHEEDERAPVRQLADGVDEEHPAAQTRGAGLAIDGICRQDDVGGRLDVDLQGRSEGICPGRPPLVRSARSSSERAEGCLVA